jgi:hypothetical protein
MPYVHKLRKSGLSQHVKAPMAAAVPADTALTGPLLTTLRIDEAAALPITGG